jgi:hypothetical protein
MQTNEIIDASPNKNFFIKTLVKDIHLMDAILDLIDNSIDSHIRNKLSNKRRISVTLSKEKFVIEDNCGGMSKESIAKRVFRFGLPAEPSEGRTIGVYGIGLKRSIFKMGEEILIESDDNKNYCSIRIDKEWLEDEGNWKLEFDKIENTKGKPFTKITIKQLFQNVVSEMEATTFENELRERIKQTYSVLIEDKVDIIVNEITVEPYDFNFLNDEKNFVPFHKIYRFNEVEVEIYAGYNLDGPYGWFIFCNDRLVIRNDLSNNTGWGGPAGKSYHYSEDNVFLGLAFFRSDNPLSLPWQTTKENIQFDSPVYRKAQVEMRAITNSLVDVIRLTGRTKDPMTEETIGRAFFEGYSSTPRKDLTKESDEKVPAVKGEKVYESISKYPKVTTIQYTQEIKIVKKVKKKLGDPHMSNKSMGEKTFDYFVEMEEVEDE